MSTWDNTVLEHTDIVVEGSLGNTELTTGTESFRGILFREIQTASRTNHEYMAYLILRPKLSRMQTKL